MVTTAYRLAGLMLSPMSIPIERLERTVRMDGCGEVEPYRKAPGNPLQSRKERRGVQKDRVVDFSVFSVCIR